MRARNRHLINILSTGVVVTVFVLIVLFAARWLVHLVRVSQLEPQASCPVDLRLPSDANDADLRVPEGIVAQLNGKTGLPLSLGPAQYAWQEAPTGPDSYVYEWERKENGTVRYFDPSLGLLVYKGMSKTSDPNGRARIRYFEYFAGPEGIATSPTEELGRFTSPVADSHHVRPQVLYDPAHRRFYALHWQEERVEKGPELSDSDGDPIHPVQIRQLWKYGEVFSLELEWPRTDERKREFRTMLSSWLTLGGGVMVLNASGRIDLLDPESMEVTKGIARLPVPNTLFGRRGPVRPEDVAAFEVMPLSWLQVRDQYREWTYAGCAIAAASRDLTSLTLAVFDPNGRLLVSDTSAQRLYSDAPGAWLLTVTQYLLENVHPPALSALSFLTAREIEAMAGYRSIVLIPNSFLAMLARDSDRSHLDRVGTAILLMLPAIGLAVFLAWRVHRDGMRMGLSKNGAALWVVGTFALGLPAYVTYRLTRPKVSLVTCRSCGLGRRSDFERCQRCGAAWVVPELIPPAWRVVDEEPAPAEQPSETEEIASEEP